MFSSNTMFAATAAFSLIAPALAANNVAVYWGSGSNQQRLRTFCDESSIDIIPIGFLDLFPQQANGFPKQDFGNACWGGSVYYGPGNDHSKDTLYTQCPTVQEDIPYCQAKGKKIVLSLGGGTSGYQLTGVAAGVDFANFLWKAYGPKQAGYTGVRPLDRGYSNTTSDTIDIDGFDFDIEHPSIDGAAGYIAAINHLRGLFSTNPNKKYLITGAPQCPLPDVSMSAMIAATSFDYLFIQFYNNAGYGCNARNWANDNPNYASTHVETNKVNLNYRAWKAAIAGGQSSNAKLFIGLVGGPDANGKTCARSDYGNYITATEADNLITAYKGDSAFGGVMIYDATSSINNTCECKPYYRLIKDSLNGIKPPQAGAACPTVTSTTTSTKPTSSSTSSTSSKPTTSSTSSTSSKPTTSSTSSTSSKPTTSSTISSTSSKPTTSSSSISSTSSKPTTSSSSSSSISSTSSKPTTSSSSSSSSSSISKPTTTSSSISSTSTSVSSITSSSSTLSTSSSSSLSSSSSSSSSSVSSTTSFSSSSSSVATSSSSTSSTASPSTSSSVTSSSVTIDPTTSTSASTNSSTSSTLSSSVTVDPTTSTSVSSSVTSSISSSSSVEPTSVSTTSSSSSVSSSVINSTTSASTISTTSIGSSASTTSSSIISTVDTTTSSVETTSITSSKFPTFTPPFGNSTTTKSTASTTAPSTIISPTVAPTTTGAPSGTTTAGPSTIAMTTSTVKTTSVYTISKCPPSVTDCPIGAVTTETKILYTTVCPVSSANGKPTPSGAPPAQSPAPSAPAQYTTSTIYATKIYTVTACPPSVPNCPGKGSVTTEIVAVYTTVCPVSNAAVPTPAPSAASAPTTVAYSTETLYTTKIVTVTACAPGVVNCPGITTTATVPVLTTVFPITSATPSPSLSGTTTIHIQSTSFYTVKVTLSVSTATIIPIASTPSVSTATIIPIASSPVAPYPTPSSATPVKCYGTATGTACIPLSTGTGIITPPIASTAPVKIVEVIPVVAEAGGNKAVAEQTSAVATATPVAPVPTAPISTGAGVKMGASASVVGVVALVMGLLVL